MTSYFKIDTGKEDTFHESNFPSWTQFLDEDYETGYGFPEHTWDQPVAGKRCIKVGTMAHDPYDPSTKNDPIAANDHRVTAVEHYVRDYMQNLRMTSSANYKHPVVLYDSRETLLDYANRTRTDIVVQNGGWIGKYYPLLARTAYDMIFNPDLIYNASGEKSIDGINYNIVKNFVNRTTYPIRDQVKDYIQPQGSPDGVEFDTVIVGAGASGLYSAYRLNYEANLKIGIFDMLDRISGRLWSVKFQGASEVMELGGMRYIEEHHRLVDHYVKKLRLPAVDFLMGGNQLQDSSLKAYLRNDRYR